MTIHNDETTNTTLHTIFQKKEAQKQHVGEWETDKDSNITTLLTINIRRKNIDKPPKLYVNIFQLYDNAANGNERYWKGKHYWQTELCLRDCLRL